jgi:hypothetical protein
MFRTHVILLALLLLPALAVPSHAPRAEAPPPKNLITNPSLEDDLAGRDLPAGWSTWPAGDTKYRCRVADGGRTGKKCLLVEGDGTRAVVFTNGTQLDRTKRYVLKGWAKLDGDPKARAIIKFNYFHQGKYLGANDLVGVTTKQKDWTLLAKTDQADDFPEASTLWVSCNLEGKGRASFDDLELTAYDRKTLPADFEARFGPSNLPAEFSVLQRHVGTWDTQTTIKPGVFVPDGLKSTGVATVEWALGKKFLQGKHKQQPGNVEALWLETFDLQSGAFRTWYFDSNGGLPRGESTGQWDEDAKTLTYKGTEPKEVSVATVLRFVDPDHSEWKGVWRDKSGKILMEIEMRSSRHK